MCPTVRVLVFRSVLRIPCCPMMNWGLPWKEDRYHAFGIHQPFMIVLQYICTTIGKYFLWSWIVPRLIKRLRQYMSCFSLGWFQDGGSESLLMTFREKEAKIWLGITLHWNYSANILVDRSQVIGFDLFIQSYIFLGPQRHLSRYKHCWKIDVVHIYGNQISEQYISKF